MKPNLSFKIIGIVLIISIISVSLNLYLNFNYLRENLELADIEKGKAVARSLTASLNDINKVDDKEFILGVVNKQLWLDPEVIQIHYFIKKGESLELFYHSAHTHQDEEIEEAMHISNINQNINYYDIVKLGNQRLLRVVTPVQISGQTVGSFQVDMTLEKLDKTVAQSVMPLIFFSLLFLFIVVFFLFFFMRLYIITPLISLNKGVEAVASGDFDYKIKIKSKDEIGDLSNSFKKMRDEIKTTHTKLKEHEKQLEKEVEKRTRELQLKIEQLEKFQKLTVGRELKMIELKEQLAKLQKKVKKK